MIFSEIAAAVLLCIFIISAIKIGVRWMIDFVQFTGEETEKGIP